jgi:SPP1 family predicted phage head-tail adaptor
MTLAAGKLRHRVRIEEIVTDQDSNGDIVQTWQTYADNVAAAVEPLSARELVQAQAMQSEVSARITIRWLSGVKATMRIVYGSAIYRIHGALGDRDSGREYLTLPVSELAD